MRRLMFLAMLMLLASAALAAPIRVLPPELPADHAMPVATEPAGRPLWWDFADAGVLLAALGLGTYMAIRRRSRAGVLAVMVGSLLYFGFVRGGCVCAVGAIQNVAQGVFDAQPVALAIVGLLAVVLGWTLVFGRVFCGSVCPLGAVQDLAVLKAIRVPAWLEHALGLVAWGVLGIAVLLAATGSSYLLCRFDPYVALFRLAPLGKWLDAGVAGQGWGPAAVAGRIEPLVVLAVLLAAGLFVARPFCRYLCPLGALFRLAGPLAWKRVSITPDNCVQCRLCENSCPFAAIRPPTADVGPRQLSSDRRRLGLTLVLLVLHVVGGSALGWELRHTLARANYSVVLVEQFDAASAGVSTSEAVEAFSQSERSLEQLRGLASRARARFAIGSPIFGGFLGLVVGLKLVQLSIRRRRADWTADPARCVACGRCFASCPVEQQRRRSGKGQAADLPPQTLSVRS